MKQSIYLIMFMLVVNLVNADLYNTTNLTNANNIYEQGKALNDITDGLLGIGLLLIVFTIATVTVIRNTGDAVTGLGAGSFITALSATMLLPLGFIAWNYYQISILVLGVAVVLALLIKRN